MARDEHGMPASKWSGAGYLLTVFREGLDVLHVSLGFRASAVVRCSCIFVFITEGLTMGNALKSGASVPMKDRPEILAALNGVAVDSH